MFASTTHPSTRGGVQGSDEAVTRALEGQRVAADGERGDTRHARNAQVVFTVCQQGRDEPNTCTPCQMCKSSGQLRLA
jgi:hypothetical protein